MQERKYDRAACRARSFLAHDIQTLLRLEALIASPYTSKYIAKRTRATQDNTTAAV